MEKTIRVVIVDDSAFMRRALTRLIGEGRSFEVIGTASNGKEALKVVSELKPDVVTMDIEMPEMNGVEALQALMSRCPVPVVMLSSLTSRGAEITMRCLELGAIDFIAKPTGSISEDLGAVRYIIWQKIRSAAGAHMNPVPTASSQVVRPVLANTRKTVSRKTPGVQSSTVVAIAASTGGPRALLDVLVRLPADLSAGVVVVQHMPAHFTAAMAQRFDANCQLSVREAQAGDVIEDGVVLVAPGGRHLRIAPAKTIELSDEPPLWGVRPAADFMIESAAEVFGASCLGVVLTGMGRDGTQGLTTVKHGGGTVIAQDEASCVVYGMPRTAVEAGVVDEILPLNNIADGIIRWCQQTAESSKRRLL